MSAPRCQHGCALELTTWVVEWSPDQRSIHIDSLDDVLASNQRIALGETNGAPGYIPIGIFSTADEAFAFADQIEPHLCAAATRGQR